MKVLVTSLPDLAKMPPQRPHRLIERLAEGNDVTVLCTDVWWLDDVQDPYLDAILHKVDLRYVSQRKTNSIAQEALFCKNLSAFEHEKRLSEYDLHVNLNSPIAGYWISRKFGITTILDLFDDFVKWTKISPQVPFFLKPFSEPVGRYLLKRNIQSSTRITYITQALNEAYKLPPEKARLIPNGVEIDLFYKHDSRALRDELGLGDAFVIGYVGGLKSWVNLRPMLQALKATEGELDLKLLVVGEEGDLKRNVDLVKERGLSEKVMFTGFVPRYHVPAYISAMDVCLIPFDVGPMTNHSLPLKLMEYLACEKPVISTPLKGVKQAVGDHVVYAGDSASLIQRIWELYEDEDLRTSLGSCGREFVKAHYSWDTILRQFDAVVEEAIGEVASA